MDGLLYNDEDTCINIKIDDKKDNSKGIVSDNIDYRYNYKLMDQNAEFAIN